jgi:hypothetical protein
LRLLVFVEVVKKLERSLYIPVGTIWHEIKSWVKLSQLGKWPLSIEVAIEVEESKGVIWQGGDVKVKFKVNEPFLQPRSKV